MEVVVRYFAVCRERAGCSEERVTLAAGATTRELQAELVRRHPALDAVLRQVRLAVNQEFALEPRALGDGDVVALIPPVAGGSDLFRVQSEPLEPARVQATVEGPGLGGVVLFVGNVRAVAHGRQVLRLEYEAYPEMAEAQMRRIGNEIRARWPGTRVAMQHRVGVLGVGEAAVVIAVSAPHRREAFEGCAHAIERLKQDVPIWKKEHTADGAVWVGLGP